MKGFRNVYWTAVVALLLVFLGLTAWSGAARAQSADALPVPGIDAAKDLPGEKEVPDPSVNYKVVFDIGTAAPKIDDVNPGLIVVARYLNTLAKHGVPAEHRTIAVVFHQGAAPIVQDNATFKTRYGHDNPNVALIQNLKKAGVDLKVCGQAVLANNIDPKTIQSEIELDLWALTTLVNLQLRGYVRVGN